jgi:integrase
MLQALRKAGRLPAVTSRDHVTDNLAFVDVDQPRPRPLRPAQLRELIAACQRHDADSGARTPIGVLTLTLLLTGMRFGEAQRLTWDDVDLDDGVIRVVPGKTGRERDVDLAVCPSLVRLLSSLPRDVAGG